MGDRHQDIVIKNVENDELDNIAEKVVNYLIEEKIISSKKSDNVLGKDLGYAPGEHWNLAVKYPEEEHFLELWTNGLEIRKGRTVFWADGGAFEKIECPKCGENNLHCEWGELFGQWIENPTSANLECITCKESSSISEYKFEPIWALSNLGFVFWNWPIFKNSFIIELEKLTGKQIIKVEGKL